MKRLVSILLSLSLALFMFGGCKDEKGQSSKTKENNSSSDVASAGDEAVSAKEVIDEVIKNFENVESMHLKAETCSSMNVMGNVVDAKATVECDVNSKDKIQYMEMVTESAEQKSSIECYLKENDEGADVYLLVNGMWVKQTSIPSDKVDELGLSSDSYDLMVLYLELLKEECEMSEEKVNGTDCYFLSGKIDAGEEELLEKIGLGNVLMMLVQSGMTESQIDEIISGVGKFDIKIAVDKEKFLPIQIEVDMTSITQHIMDGLSEALDDSGEIKVDKNVAVSVYSKYNEIGKIVIPQDALNAPETQLYQ